jgi:hypothetical protein
VAQVAKYLIRDECGWKCRAGRRGAATIEDERAGASSAPVSMRSHGSETVAGFGVGIAEAAVLADEVDRVL